MVSKIDPPDSFVQAFNDFYTAEVSLSAFLTVCVIDYRADSDNLSHKVVAGFSFPILALLALIEGVVRAVFALMLSPLSCCDMAPDFREDMEIGSLVSLKTSFNCILASILNIWVETIEDDDLCPCEFTDSGFTV
ncbi:MAG: hypothetical protein HYX48_01880 [Chlamydiales bacterium]|nr:hypothetical protein [Chlamydiales bacterium]